MRDLDRQHLRHLGHGPANVPAHDVRRYPLGFLCLREMLIGFGVGSVLAPEPFRLHEIRRTALVQEMVQEVTESMRSNGYPVTVTVHDCATVEDRAEEVSHVLVRDWTRRIGQC
ncbi:hypothetical protein BZM27_50620 [Paraburkholderia steynii]|uniref:Uncharacterized protein n=1 Tax=Paraburkholderia steynii TaxID=1245441 RepID=A0A4R0X8J4_9BURK|nr:hypothetical protein BZM27_50620 [Paraburkholderia steynii]